MNYSYRFPVVKGIQAGRIYYIAMVPLKMLSRLFPSDDEYILPEYRAQRKINQSRIPEIKNYILNNNDSYVFSALAASIDGEFNYIHEEQNNIGFLEVAMDAKFLINDGQHRKAAIIAAIDEAPELKDETIPVVFFEDKGLARSQQMFTDLNKHAVKTSNSIAELYDSRDQLAVATRNVIASIPFYEEYVDKERDILGKFSSSLFTLNTFYTANKKILKRNQCDEIYKRFILKFWKLISLHMVPWNELQSKELSKKELREQYIASQAVVIQAFGRVGAHFFEDPAIKMEEYIPQLESISWKRSSEDWRLRVIRSNGRMINNESAILLTANVIKEKIGLPLSEDERIKEDDFIRNNIIKVGEKNV